ncbi:hypothetical protein PM10SUCC1_22790 [Propionigenium maris DSM 9537]|uniref:Uncharacterized protein n=1 Tax=Propionigenium maris DSM 9537 TaxID=1123000 RepID=A0A9W6LPB1_9FUSO|nr:hypothetical protein [Propionigenium maris]GLI56765.1 hypothetical protein PM10SUCC1_22790 [Propionigenium maris DSM 9537]
MNLNELRELLKGRRVLIEGKWELLEFDSVGIVNGVEEIDDLLVITLDNQSKFIGRVTRVKYEDSNTLDFISTTPEENEIIIFRVKPL